MKRAMETNEILGYLCDIERKLPQHKYKMYVPKYSSLLGTASPEDASLECTKMLEFAFMEGYRANVKFIPMDDNTAGNTIPGKCENGTFEINVADRLQNNWKIVLATLAHEVCHQVIHHYGIRPMVSWMTETYVDLATIYVGFGQLILNGYQTYNISGIITLGYLSPDTYQVTNHLVNIVCGGVNSKNIDSKGIDSDTTETIKLWEENDDKRNLLIDCFKRSSATLAEKQRNIACLENVLLAYRESLVPTVQQLEQTFLSNTGLIGHKERYSLAAFRCLYDDLIISKYNIYSKKPDVIETALYHIYSECAKTKEILMIYDIVCPICGKHYHRKERDAGLKSIKCAHCGTHFVITTDEWKPESTKSNITQNRQIHAKQQAKEYIKNCFPAWLRWLAKKHC